MVAHIYDHYVIFLRIHVLAPVRDGDLLVFPLLLLLIFLKLGESNLRVAVVQNARWHQLSVVISHLIYTLLHFKRGVLLNLIIIVAIFIAFGLLFHILLLTIIHPVYRDI